MTLLKSLTRAYHALFPGWLILLLFSVMNFGIEFFNTVRTDAVSKVRFRVFLNINFNLLPVAFVIANFFAVRAYREESSHGFDLGKVII